MLGIVLGAGTPGTRWTLCVNEGGRRGVGERVLSLAGWSRKLPQKKKRHLSSALNKVQEGTRCLFVMIWGGGKSKRTDAGESACPPCVRNSKDGLQCKWRGLEAPEIREAFRTLSMLASSVHVCACMNSLLHI